jgi:glycosyltransferase involved in cell wall biosynthesis
MIPTAYARKVPMLVSIVIPAYNAARTIRKCLEAIGAQTYPRPCYEVIVVDNNSADDTPHIVGEYPWVRLAYERAIQGPHAATNTGVCEAQGDILVFTDSDCVPETNWLATLVAPFADPDVVAVGGRIETYAPTSRVEKFLDRMHPFTNCVRLTPTFPASIITGNAAYRAQVFRDAGMFNANMYTGAEVDLAWRVQWATGKQAVYAPDAVVYHQYNPSVRRLFRHFRIYGYSEIVLGTLYKDRPGYPRPPHIQIGIMLRQVWALFTYVVSFFYRCIKTLPHGWDADYVFWPVLWLVAESGSIYGKLEGMWATRFYRKNFWEQGPCPI